MPATIAQIADIVGVSRQAVSCALNNRSGQVSEKTRKRILVVAEELAYRPNSSARATRTGRMGCVDLLMSTSPAHSRLPSRLLDALHDRLAEHETRLAIFRLPDERLSDDHELPTAFRLRSADALLVNYTHGSPEGFGDMLVRLRIPAVWIHAKAKHDCVYSVGADAYRRLTQRLIALGHRRIAYWAFHPDGHFSEEDRFGGYESAMLEAGLTPTCTAFDLKSNQHYRENPGTDDRIAHARRALDRPDRPTAIVCYGGTESMIALFAANSLGLSVPRDLSLVALQDEGDNQLCLPLTTCVIPQTEIARAAIDLVMRKIKSPTKKFDPRPIPLHTTREEASLRPPSTDS